LEGFRKEIRTLNQQSTNLDIRLNRSLESNEKLRNALKCSQIEEKELRNQIRKLQEDKKLAIKNLEKQRSELVQAFKKQTLLVDNLKKQNIHLMANGQISLTKEDFAKLLEWKPQNVSDVS
ncbi:PREDICTED: testis-expressed sequence 9 protein-like, partial [Wasmannia auropunctata]